MCYQAIAQLHQRVTGICSLCCGSVAWLDTLDTLDKSDHNLWEYMAELDHNLMRIDPSHGDGTMSRQQAIAGAGSAQKVDTPELEPAPRMAGD